jgi:hypothetical protein
MVDDSVNLSAIKSEVSRGLGGHPAFAVPTVFDAATTARLRGILDEVCESVSVRETGA